MDLRHISASTVLESLCLSNSGLRSLEGISRAKRLSKFVAVGNHGLAGLPDELFRMSTLKQLYLSNNKLNGNLPTALFSMPNLEELSMPNNEFHGSIPKEVGSMKKLRELVLSENNLTGSIPTELNEVTTLERVALMAQNGPEPIKGRLPDFAKAPNLWYELYA